MKNQRELLNLMLFEWIRRYFNKILTGLLLITATSGMHAQVAESPAGSLTLEEILVTARYRKENIQDVPLSETVFSEQQIIDARIDQVGDFLDLTPNVTFVPEADFGGSFITIRGVSQVRNVESPVAVVVDGIQQIHPSQFTQELFDIGSIEVLRGPQGALYGRNASGGAIIINTVEPTNEFKGSVSTRVGKNNEFQIQGSVSGALVEDKWFYRVGARSQERDGYLKSLAINKYVDPVEDQSLRSTLRYTGDALDAQINLNITRFEGGANNFVYQGILYDPTRPGEYFLRPGFFDPPIEFNTSDPRIDADDTSVPYTQNNVGFTDRDVNEFSVKLDYEFDAVTLTSITAYSEFEAHQTQDGFPYTASGSPDETGAASYLDVSGFNQEFRLASNNENSRLRWMGGVFYLQTDRFIALTQNEDLGRGIPRIERTSNDPANQAIGPNIDYFADDNENTAWSVFGNASYDMTDDLEISFAYRYDNDDRKQKVSPFQTTDSAGSTNSVDFSEGQPKLSLRYSINNDVNLYASWGRGFRSGQFNQAGLKQRTEDEGLFGITDLLDKEVTETAEVGFKSEWFDGRLRVNGSIFSTDVEGFFYFAFIPQTGDDALINIDNVTLKGGEVEFVAALSDNFEAYAAFGVTDSKIDKYTPKSNAAGNRAPYVAKNTFNIGGQYRANLSDNVGLFARLDFERRGKQFWDPENTSARSPINFLTLRFGLESTNGNWSVIGTVNNALDEEFNSEYVGGDFPGIPHRGLPKIYNVDFTYNF